MGEDMKRLISVRGAYRGHCTRAIKSANEIKESYSPNLDTLEDVFEGLCSRMERLLYRNRRLSSLFQKIKLKRKLRKHLNTLMI